MATAWLWGGRSLDLEEWQLPLGRQEIQQGSELPVAASVQALLSSGSAPCPCQKHLRCPQWSCRACSTSCWSSMSGWAYSVPACALLQQPRYKNNVSVSFQCRAHTACLFVSILAAGIGYCTAEALWLPQNYVGNAPRLPSPRGHFLVRLAGLVWTPRGLSGPKYAGSGLLGVRWGDLSRWQHLGRPGGPPAACRRRGHVRFPPVPPWG